MFLAINPVPEPTSNTQAFSSTYSLNMSIIQVTRDLNQK